MTPARQPCPDTRHAATPQAIGRAATLALHDELALSPKPGLVTLDDNGSHADMDASTFLRSLFALRHYFRAVASASARGDGFEVLRQHGIAAETAMLRATGGVNTHRGAIFSLGLLVASASAYRQSSSTTPTGEQVCEGVRQWAHALGAAPLDPHSPGQRARVRHGVAGVREEAAAGYPVLRTLALPTLRHAIAAGLSREAALCHTLMQLVAHVDDLNLLHRGGAEGLRWARDQATGFIADGGAFAPGWRARLQTLCKAFAARRLSPGGSADLLACSWFLLQQEAV